MNSIVDIVSFLLYCVIVTATPGPANIAILSISTNSGISKTLRYIAGAISAFFIIILLSVLLNSALSAAVPAMTAVMRYAGSLYILYLSYQILKTNGTDGMSGQTATFASGFIMQFVNPKIWLLTMTVIPGYILPYYTQAYILFGFSLIITAIALMAFMTWAMFGAVLVRFLNHYQKAVNIILALLLLYSAVEVSGIMEIVMG